MTGLEYKPRRPLDDDKPDGYLESDQDYLLNNRHLAVALLDAYGAGKTIPKDWVVWNGGNCPVPSDTPVRYRMRDGDYELTPRPAGALDWSHSPDGKDWEIVAYEVAE